MELRGTARYATRRSQHEEVRFLQNELTCSGVNRSECIVRDYCRFEIERTPTDEETTMTRLLVEAGGVFNPRAVAKHLVAHGVVMKG